jgi:microcystin-dependent protein
MEEYIGGIKIFAGTFAPAGWALCDGQLMSIQDNTALFSLLGVQYGGDGKATFGLPDLEKIKSKNGAELLYIICVSGIYPSRP